MMDLKTVERNILGMADMLTKQQTAMIEMRERIEDLEKALALLGLELTNNKQMTAHVLGRGMGPTVVDNGE